MEAIKTSEKRLLHYDLLRIFACFSVVMLHSASQFWYDYPVTDRVWLVANTYDAIFRFGVPIFVMISGALFLKPSKQISLKRLYTHNIVRLVTAYVLWSCVYGIWDSRTFDSSVAGWKDYVFEMMSGRYHLWFLPMLIGIYMLLPILKTWIHHASKKEIQYFIVLFIVFQIIKETALLLIASPNVKQLILDAVHIEMVCSYVGYFIIGYYIAHVEIPKHLHRWIYMGGLAGVTLAVVVGNLLSLKAGEPTTAAYDSYSLFTFMVVVAVFLFFQEKIAYSKYLYVFEGMIKELSVSTFGIYLAHILMIEWLQTKGIHSMSVNNMVGIPLLAVICFVICYGVVAIVRRIPYVGKYIC